MISTTVDATHKGKRYQVTIEIETDRIVNYLVARALRNKTKRATVSFAKAKAREVK